MGGYDLQSKKPMISERNSVTWLNENGKVDERRRFIRAHARAYPKIGISASRRYTNLILATFFVIMLFAASFFGYTPFTTIICTAAMALIIAFAADSVITGINVTRFYGRQLDNGGELADLWNEKILRSSRVVLSSVKPVLTVIMAAAMLVAYYNDTVRQIAFRGFPVFYWALILFSVTVNVYPVERVCPNVFFDPESGMIFGGALFSYDTLKEIDFSGSDGEFELYYEGRLVSRGVMLSDDRYHLQDMLHR